MQFSLVALFSLAAVAIASPAPMPEPQIQLPPFCSSPGDCSSYCTEPCTLPFCAPYPDGYVTRVSRREKPWC
ncbi:hypothetical protein BS50DRAFT_569876 [Corynespora cassiicola Philippines]|uniref:Uncharacterized protein n=1 Tax=Corynespora cassiicola Philippines TaxID=1448308 RepID=A0A2T2P3Y5_CORCC|nr:hypothetical protein BS50DRAFT_569876 [Corynespora cassiicola Philippines]